LRYCRTALFAADTVPGRLVRLLAPLADRVFLQWHAAARRLVVRHPRVTGIPVRAELFDADRPTARRRLGLREDVCTLLALGGSQGALALNRTLEGALRRLEGDLQVVHLTGVDHLPDALASPLNEARWYRPIGFLPRMGDAYAAADFVLSRAGASTLAELTALGLPSILVPYPHHADRHQYVNANLLRRAGAALVLKQAQMDDRRLLGVIRRLADDADLRARMGRNARRLGRPLAARAVACELAALAGFEISPQYQSVTTPGVQTEHSQAA
jgi:UDP-N-acetylglucosamine--N-acetylmuramyl-(pentapeptide) pyrophosphoryl-undecaprenol N-acetylglucosamine transferase